MVSKSDLKEDIKRIDTLADIRSFNYSNTEYLRVLEEEMVRQGKILVSHYCTWLRQNRRRLGDERVEAEILDVEKDKQKFTGDEGDWTDIYLVIGAIEYIVFGRRV